MRRSWTDEEIDFLKNNYPRLDYEYIADELKRSVESVKGKIVRLGLKSGHYWTEEEVEYLKSNYQIKSYKELSIEMNRKPDAIKAKVYKLKLPVKIFGQKLNGKTFGNLKVISKTTERNKKGSILWFCKCLCGNELLVPTSQLTGGKTRSCGCIKENMKGENHPSYNPLLTEEDRRRKRYIAGGDSTRKIREKVFKRDSYTCFLCSKVGGDLNAHHLNSWDAYIEQRYDLENLVTLCNVCHSNFHRQYGYGENTRKQFEEYVSTRKEVV